MNRRFVMASVSLGLAAVSTASADFTGQPLLGPLTNGSVVDGTTAGKSDDNDGFDSGTHIFFIWDGGDDVYTLDWLGGDMTVTLTNSPGGVDNDLFIYRPGSLDSTGDYSIRDPSVPDVVTILNAGPGTYYINVDTTFFTEGGYQLSVTPAPSSGLVLAAGLVFGARRRRR